jgi:hypothetical protein
MELSKTDRWLVLSPGRTGSKMIVDCVRGAYRDQGMRLHYIMPKDEVSFSPNLSILHSHRITDTHLMDAGVNVILSTRDLVDSAISWCVVSKIGNYHLYPVLDQNRIDQLNQQIPKFYLSPDEFYLHYKNICKFYERLPLIENMITIDYDEIKDDYTVIYERLGLPKPIDEQMLSIKNPGTPEQWITNWEEISELISKLERLPLK